MATDHCAEAEALRKIKRDLITGTAVSQTEYDGKSVRFTKADLPRLDALITEAETQCALQEGRAARRTRHARGVRFRPY